MPGERVACFACSSVDRGPDSRGKEVFQDVSESVHCGRVV